MGTEGRIATLEEHRKQWRRTAFHLAEALREIDDPEAGAMWMRERAREALAIFNERDAGDPRTPHPLPQEEKT